MQNVYNNAPASFETAKNYRDWVNNDRLVARYLNKYGFKYKDESQIFGDNYRVFKTGSFGYPWGVTDNYEVSFHHNAMTWDNENWAKTKQKEFLFDKIGLLDLYHTFKQIKRKLHL